MEKQELDFSLAFGSAVHDVKNSIGLLLHSLGEFLEENPPGNDDETRRAVVLNYEASRINSDMMQLLSIYRLQNEKLQLSFDETNVAEFLEDEILAHQTLLEIKGISLNVDCDDALYWYFDPMLVRIVLNNVFVNTIRYTRSKIEVTARVSEGYLAIAVEDDGPGYPEQLCKDPGGYMQRVNCNSGSTGLGLYFSSRAAELHRSKDRKGYIAIDNHASIGGGAFRLFLP